jgi:hypothetical protein
MMSITWIGIYWKVEALHSCNHNQRVVKNQSKREYSAQANQVDESDAIPARSRLAYRARQLGLSEC